jgi:hypothetical protein
MVPIRKGYWIRQFRFGSVTNLFFYRKRMVENIDVKTNVPLTSPKKKKKIKKNIGKKKYLQVCIHGVTPYLHG